MWFNAIFRRPDPAASTSGGDSEDLADSRFLRRLDRLALRTGRFLRGEAVGRRPSWRRLPAKDFQDHRLYLPGDDLRHVDWNASARSEHVFIKLGDRPRETAVHVLLDTSASMDWGHPGKHLACRRLGLALGYLALSHGDRLTATSLGDLGLRFGPAQGKGQIPHFLRFMRALPVHGRTDVAEAARAYARQQPRGGYAVLISDLLEVDALQSMLDAFPLPQWQLLVAHLLHPAELDPIVRGEVELEDAETGERFNYDIDAKAVERYRQAARAWCDELEQACSEETVAYARILSDWPIEQAVLPYLQRRGVVQPA